MAQVQCTLVWYAYGAHIEQLNTGFLALHKSGLIRLSQRSSDQPFPNSTVQHLQKVGGSQLTAVLNAKLRVHYDCHDAVELNERMLEECDFYFKRSYSQQYVDALPRHRGKVFPLGLCYRVLPNAADWRSVKRALLGARGTAKLAALIAALDAGNWLKYNPRLRDLQALPDPELPPRVLFLANAYDPYDAPGRSKQKIEEITALNDTRARCIETLRKELGSRFLGGFMHNPYSVRNYGRLVVEDNRLTRKRNYIRLLRSFPICVATSGLHGSIGWKFAEYVALSKAIVSEKLNYQVPGGLEAGRNYLQFVSPEQCAEQCLRLAQDRELRNSLMINNALYYQSHLRPDVLVLNSLLQALSVSGAQPHRLNALDAAIAPARAKPAPRPT
jgi:hypothetical protein